MRTATSIDAPAKGLLRHRFMRASAAAAFLLLAAFSAYFAANWWLLTPRLTVDPFARASGAVMMAAMGVGAILLAAHIFASMHRRLVAVVALGAFLYLAFFSAFMGFSAVVNSAVETDVRLAVFVACGAGAVLAAQGLAWSRWQLATSRAGFLAARGWRAPLSLVGAVHRSLSMPAFVSWLGRGRIGLFFACAGIGVLNSAIPLLAGPMPYFYTKYFVAGGGGDRVWLALLGSVALFRILGAGRLLDAYAEKSEARIHRAIRECDERAPIVFLRSAEAGARVLPALTRDPFLAFAVGVSRARTLDRTLLECASPYGPVAASAMDETRAETLASLAKAAKAIVVSLDDSENARSAIGLVDAAGARERAIFLTGPGLSREAAWELFAGLAPAGQAIVVRRDQTPVAAFIDASGVWQILSASLAPSMQIYTIGLNMALMAKFGPARPRSRTDVEYRVVERSKSKKRVTEPNPVQREPSRSPGTYALARQ